MKTQVSPNPMRGPVAERFATERIRVNDAVYTVFSKAPKNLGSFYREAIDAHHESAFFIFEEERYRFEDVGHLIDRVGAALVGHGIGRGDRIGIAMRNFPEWAWVFLAATSIGAVAVCLNSWWSSQELKYGVQDSGLRLLFADAERFERVSPWLNETGVECIVVRASESAGGTSWAAFMTAKTTDYKPGPVPIEPEDPAAILYTSGSSGRPKGVLSTHRAIIHAVMGYEYGSALADERALAEGGSAPKASRFAPALLITAPLFHVTGLNSQLLLSLRLGRKIVAMRKWDAEIALAAIERERITHFSGVPTMVSELMHSPKFSAFDVSSLEAITGGGAAMTPKHTEGVVARSEGRIASRTGYAMTETNGIAASHGGRSLAKRPTSVGRAQPPLVSIKVVDEAGNTCAALVQGEVLIHGAMNCSGYWNRPDETARTLQGGWIHSGDLGHLDEDGFLYITGRLKDQVVRGGEKISCIDVESALSQHPGVIDCIVFGVPDERLGEKVACLCEVSAHEDLSADLIRDYLAPSLAAYKIPEIVYFQRTPLPRLASGKVDRLRAKASLALSAPPTAPAAAT